VTPGGGLRVTVAIVLLAAVAAFAIPASAQQQPPILIKEITVEGNRRV